MLLLKFLKPKKNLTAAPFFIYLIFTVFLFFALNHREYKLIKYKKQFFFYISHLYNRTTIFGSS